MNQDKYIGQLLDNRYEIIEVLGVGGMAVVYKARCRRLNRMVAIKILKDEYSQDEEFRSRFHAESQAVAMLSHPNIVSVYDVSSSEDSDYIVMELIDGITLKYYMEKKGVLNWKETLHFAMQIAKALEHAHSRGIVHRDIKPHNVMVLKNGSVKVADFGIAQMMSGGNTMTQEALGSVHYISPEQAKGSRVDSRSDVYSLGIVMYEMISGRVPYDGETPLSVVMKHINGGAQLPTSLNPNTPKALEQIIMKAIANSPKDRYATATAMLYDMDEFRKNPTMVFTEDEVEEEPVVKPVEPKPAEKTIAEKKVPQKRKEPETNSRTTTIAIAACGVVGLVALIILILLLPSCQGNGNQITVPNLVGQMYDNLPSYEGIQIELQGSEYDPNFPEGVVMYQSPSAGEQVDKGAKVFVIVSLGSNEIVLEDLAGKKVSEAKAYIEGLGLKFVRQAEQSDAVDENCVIRTDPAAGSAVRRGQAITVYYRAVPRAVVPEVTGLLQDAAIAKLEDAGFFNYEIVEEKNDLPYGTVLRITPVTEGKEAKTGEKITIYISKGKAMLEELSGKTLDEVAQYLEALDMMLNVDYVQENSPDIEDGLVVRTEPVAGTELLEGQNLVIYYSAGPGMVVVPDLRGKTPDEVRQTLIGLGIRNIREKEISSVLIQGAVVKLSVAPGTQVDAASQQVVVYISKGDQGLLELSGMPLENAKAALDALELGLVIKEIGTDNEEIPAGTVMSTDPAAGSSLTFGQEITLQYSAGRKPVPVPDVEGDTLVIARQKLLDAGFTSLTVEETYSDRPIGQVLGLSVQDGELVKPDTQIIILVSKGQAKVEHTFTFDSHETAVNVTILCDGVAVVENQTLEPGVDTLTLTLKGSGSQIYEIHVDGVLVKTETVEFG